MHRMTRPIGAVDPLNRRIIRVREGTQRQIAIVLGQALQLQPAVEENLVAFADLGVAQGN